MVGRVASGYEAIPPKGLGPRPLPVFTSITLALEELYFILNTLGPWGKFSKPRTQTGIGSTKHVPGFPSPYMRASRKALLD